MLWSIALPLFANLALGSALVEAEAPSRQGQGAVTSLGIEVDLSKLSGKHYRAWNSEENCTTNADQSFDQAVQQADLEKELTETEKAKFKKRFILEMLHDCKHDPDIAANWVKDVADALQNQKPVVTAALVKQINDQDLGWTAGVQEGEEDLSQEKFNARLGYIPPGNESVSLLSVDKDFKSTAPGTWMTAKEFPMCKEVIEKVHNQGTCGSCWAFGTLSAMDSRLCIGTKGYWKGDLAVLSRSFVTACSYQGRDGCQGGNFPAVYKLMSSKGSPLGSKKGCIPYFGTGEGIDHFDSQSRAPPCMSQCVTKTPAYPRSLRADTFKVSGMSGREWGPFHRQPWKEAEAKAREEIYKGGPLPIAVNVDRAFQSYNDGVFKNNCNSRTANHVTSAIGYTPEYFNTLNSWGPKWGRNGQMDMANCEIAEWSLPSNMPLGDYTIPGASPAPGPGPAPGPAPGPGPAPRPTPASREAWKVTSGPCKHTEEGCIHSSNFGSGDYGADEECTITVTGTGGAIVVEGFNTEKKYDALTVNGKEYSGKDGGTGLTDVTPTGTMTWKSDKAEHTTGWKLCPKIPPPKWYFDANTGEWII